MMTDRELLELAAKAAGIGGGYDSFREEYRKPLDVHGLFLGRPWKPLDDDGESQRLGVRLMLDIRHTSDEVAALGYNGQWQHEPVAGDRGPATRRAIVRAAASYGKAMFP